VLQGRIGANKTDVVRNAIYVLLYKFSEAYTFKNYLNRCTNNKSTAKNKKGVVFETQCRPIMFADDL